jgi:glycosyltransferase involved in cell wall biosynthesis
MESILVSVVIPCYNQAHFLGEAIESVIRQTYRHFEIIVIDDGATDNTSEVAAGYAEVRCVRQENQGLSAARNRGLSESKGAYLVFLDADDRLLPHALETGVRYLDAHPRCAFVSGHCQYIAFDGTPLETSLQPHPEKDHYQALLLNNYIWMPGTVMYRRTIFESVKGFDTSLNACEDYDFYLKAARSFPVYCHGHVIAEYRRHQTSMSANPARMLRAVLGVLRAQHEHVRKNVRLREAHKAGIRYYQELYGEQLVNEVRAAVRGRERWTRALRDMRVLLRYYPRGVVKNAGRKLYCTVTRVKETQASGGSARGKETSAG